VYSKKDQQAVLKMINSKALGTFAFDRNGELYLKSPKGDASKYSKYYQDRLVEAINQKENTIVIDIESHYLDPEDNKTKNLDDPLTGGGGGVTLSEIQPASSNSPETKVATVYISGNSNTEDIRDTKNQPLVYEADDILMHELLGHAIPFIAKPDTGNAIKNENKAQEQTKDRIRKAEITHEE